MPRPKGAGRSDPRLGQVSSRILDQIIREYDSGQKERLFRRIRRLQRRAERLALADGGLQTFGPDGPIGPPPCAIAAQVANQIAMSEEVISRIRSRDQETEGRVMALFHALHEGVDTEERDCKPTRVIVKYASGIESEDDGDSAQPASEPGTSGPASGQ